MHRPESLLEIIVFRGAETMYIAVCTMMVGDKETLVGNDASGTSELQGNHCVGNACPRSICIVDLSCRQLQSTILHLLLKGSIDRMNHPHSFVRFSAKATHQRDCCYNDDLFENNFHSIQM